MSKVWTSVMLILILAAGGLVALMIQDRAALHRRLVEGDVKNRKLEAEIATLRAERDRLLGQTRSSSSSSDNSSPEVARTGSGAAEAKGGTVTSAKAGTADAMAQGRKMWTEMMKNPAMKEVMKQQRVAMLESQYGKLFGRFSLSDEEKNFFKDLLSERLALDTELGIKLMGEDLTNEQRSAILKEHQDGKKASDARIRDFLNSEDDYSAFSKWEDTKGERMQIDMGRSLFENAGEALSPQQEQQLVDTMHRLRSSDGANDFSKPENFDPSRFNDEEIKRQLARIDEQARQVYEAAASFLSPAQLSALRSLQQQWRAMGEAGLRMAATMFQGQKHKK